MLGLFHGKVQDISRVLDPATRSAKVRIVLPNSGGSLRPGMFSVASFRSRTKQSRLLIPTTAVMRLQDKDWVFRKEGEHRFRRVEVQSLGDAPGGMVQIQNGMKPGDEVIAAALEFSTAMAGQGK